MDAAEMVIKGLISTVWRNLMCCLLDTKMIMMLLAEEHVLILKIYGGIIEYDSYAFFHLLLLLSNDGHL